MNERREMAIQLLWEVVKVGTVLLSIATVIVLIWGENNLMKNEDFLGRVINPKRFSLESCIEYYWSTIPVQPVTKTEYETIVMELNAENAEYQIQTLNAEKTVYLEYTEQDLEELVQCMFAEEGTFFRQWDENPELVEYVHKLAGSVVLHRLENNHRGCETIHEVIFCKGQYALQTQERVTNGQDVPDIVYIWAEELLTEGPLGPNNLIYQSEFKQGDVYEIIGNQYFGTEPNLPAEAPEQ